MPRYICAMCLVILLTSSGISFANDEFVKIELPHGISLRLPGDWQSKYEKDRKLQTDRPVVLLAAAKPDAAGSVSAWLKISAISSPNFFIPVDLASLSQKDKDKLISDAYGVISRGNVPGKNDIKNLSVTIENLNGFYCLKATYFMDGNLQQNCTTMTFNRNDIGISIEAVFRSDFGPRLDGELNKILSTITIGKR